MSKRKKTLQKRRYGSSAKVHSSHARLAAEYVRDDARLLRAALKRRDCKTALNHLVTLKGNVAAMLVNRQGAGRAVKTAHTGSARAIQVAIRKVDACYRDSGKSSYERNNEY